MRVDKDISAGWLRLVSLILVAEALMFVGVCQQMQVHGIGTVAAGGFWNVLNVAGTIGWCGFLLICLLYVIRTRTPSGRFFFVMLCLAVALELAVDIPQTYGDLRMEAVLRVVALSLLCCCLSVGVAARFAVRRHEKMD